MSMVVDKEQRALASHRAEIASAIQTLDMREERRQLDAMLRPSEVGPVSGMEEALLRERLNTVDATRTVDDLIETAHTTAEELDTQGHLIRGARSKVTGVYSRIPSISTIIGKVAALKRRDLWIMTILISLCIVLLLWAAIF
ncbi:golgi SNAP receptor complex, subunit 1 [Kipferlia bialata]|uniref:Golgi SNAP receptor complex, subunit 1 n=1 Tax=Kipferlia bialata TaxID=797122 RepID=A0A9K3CUM2_9EUKA|nr:golgi SNAP receptor complex, subunit 1 [Kipferlia bialata]|eukprot:g4528.t1